MDRINILTEITNAARLIRRAFDDRARDFGVTRPQWRVMSVLMQHEGVNQGRLADLLEVEPITLCRMVDRLQDAGLVERRRDPSDRRAWRLYLTTKAHGMKEELQPMADEVLDLALDGLGDQRLAELERAMSRICDNLSRRAPVSNLSSG